MPPSASATAAPDPRQPFELLAMTPRERVMTAITFIMGMIPIFMSATMVNVAISDIMGAYGVGQDRVHWVSTGFLTASTLAMLLNGWFVGNVGPRRTYLFAMAIFFVASLVTQVANEFHFLIALRIVQGFSAGLMQPLAATTFFVIFPLSQRGKAMAFFSMGVVIAPTIGPYLGGLIVDTYGWRYIFLPALPICLIGCVFALRYIPEQLPQGQIRSFNWISFILVAGGIASLFTALSNGHLYGWSETSAVIPALLSGIAFVSFIWWELNTRTPLLEVRNFTERNFAMSSIVAFVFGMGMFSSIYVLPQFIRSVQGLDAATAGLALIPGGLAMMMTSSVAGYLSQYWPPRRTIMIGLVMFAVSAMMYHTADINTSLIYLMTLAVIGRMGLSTIMPSLSFHGVRFLAPRMLPYGTGSLNFTRQLGGAIGVNMTALVLDFRYIGHRQDLIATQTPDNVASMENLRLLEGLLHREGFEGIIAKAHALGFLMQEMMAKAATLAFQDAFIFTGILFVIALIPALFLSGKTLQQSLRDMELKELGPGAALGRVD